MQVLAKQSKEQKAKLVKMCRDDLARKYLGDFALTVNQNLKFKDFHEKYYRVLHLFALGLIMRLIITMPPQHGKSEGSSRIMPAFILGHYPDKKIAITSYSSSFAKKFNRSVQRYIDSPVYASIFPDTQLNASSVVSDTNSWLRNSEEFEIVNKRGGLKAVGREGQLTGDPVDVLIMDDMYKNSTEGNSPVIRGSVIDFYIDVARNRLHNDSQELIDFTRWHEEDLVGWIMENEEYIIVNSLDDINPDSRAWHVLNFEAIKESPPTDIDPRKIGEALWPERHNLVGLEEKRKLDANKFSCTHQGNPSSSEGRLYGEFGEYSSIPTGVIAKNNYTDTADKGDNYLCSISYDKVKTEGKVLIYVTDVLYTQDPMEETEPRTALMLNQGHTRLCRIESNAGGRGFARAVKKLVKTLTKIAWFHQSGNKESRILTNAATVTNTILFPKGWKKKWPKFAYHVETYKRLFAANEYDDAPDVLTGIVEKEILVKKAKGIKRKQ